MADFTALKTAIQNAIKQNGNEEITGNLLQEVLLAIVTTLGDGSINDLITALGSEATTRGNADATLQQNIDAEAQARGNADTALGGRIDGVIESINAINTAIGNGYVYAGIATPSSTPTTGKVFYLALTAGTYTNFGNIAVTQGINILKYNGSAWSLDTFVGFDDTPTPNSPNLVKSGGAFDSVMTNGSAFDISAHFASGGTLATYANLSAALTALNTLSAAYKKGGMSIKFVQSSDNKYVQYRLMLSAFTAAQFTNAENWSVCEDGVYVERPQYIEVKTDGDDTILEGTKNDGTKFFNKEVLVEGVPIKASLETKVVKEAGKGLSSNDYTDDAKEIVEMNSLIENHEYVEVITDENDRVVKGTKKDGKEKFLYGVDIDGCIFETVKNKKYIEATVDKNGRIINAVKKDGTVVIPKLETGSDSSVDTDGVYNFPNGINIGEGFLYMTAPNGKKYQLGIRCLNNIPQLTLLEIKNNE